MFEFPGSFLASLNENNAQVITSATFTFTISNTLHQHSISYDNEGPTCMIGLVIDRAELTFIGEGMNCKTKFRQFFFYLTVAD